MVVRDRRDVTDPDAMYQELLEHLRIGTNGGNIQITMTVFRPKLPKERWGPRVWNSQLVRYAAYEQEDGTILGDPANLGLTKALIKQGWQPPQPRSPYDVLPIVIEVPGMEPKMYELPPEKDRIIILYGSETGTAEALARKASRQLQQFHPKVMALDEYDTKSLAEEKLLLVVTSTFGNGEIPGNGQKFLKWLKGKTKGDLNGLNYSLLGIGSTVYEHFCAAGIAVDKALSKAGANCIVPLHKGDEIKGQADTFKTWLGLVSRILGTDATSADTSLQSNVELKVTYLESSEVAVSNDKGIEVPVVANQELLREVIPGSRSTRFIAFDISQTHLKYETGDHLTVYPCNPTSLVNRLCQRLGVDAQTYFTATYVDADGNELEDKPPIAVPTTVGQILSEELDLSLREPFNELLEFMYSKAENSQEKYQLETWLAILKQGEEHPDSVALKKTLTDNFMSVVDLFDDFPSAKITLSMLIELLPKIKPRLYSISSSPLLHPQQIQITVGVLQVKTDAGKTRQGLCSNYLAGLTPVNKVRVSVSTSGFRPPTDPEAVMLMVAPEPEYRR